MAKVSFFSVNVVSSTFTSFSPGQVMSLIAWQFNEGDAISVTAHALSAGHVRGDTSNDPLEPTLEVENLRTEFSEADQANPKGVRRIFFDVRNVGTSFVPEFVVGIASINK